MTDKKIKEPLTTNTKIGSRKIPAAEFRKFFKQTLGDDYENYPLARNVIKASVLHRGKTLGEIIEECINPSGNKSLEEILAENRFSHIPQSEKDFILAFDKVMNSVG